MEPLVINNPMIWRGLERIIISLGAIAFGYLGYKLYKLGVKKNRNTLTVKSSFLKFALSGTGPGLVFMAFGATVLIAGLFTGGASIDKGSNSKAFLYSSISKDCERLQGSPDEFLASALKTSRLPWASRLAEEFKEAEVLRKVVEVMCEN
jgi:hypothetical protein